MADPAAAFVLGDGADACLLLHGLTGAPSEVRPIGEALAREGIRAVGPLLPGHGSRPEDLEAVTRGQVLDAARAALAGLRGARRIFICGLSMGALLALRLAAEAHPPVPIDGLALLAPAVEFAGMTWLYAQVLGRLPRLPSMLVSKGGRDIRGPQVAQGGVNDRGPLHPDGSYRQTPLRWGRELRLLAEEALADAPQVRVRTLVLHGGLDRTASPRGARRLVSVLGSHDIELHVYPRSGHVLPLDIDGAAACAAVVKFLKRSEG